VDDINESENLTFVEIFFISDICCPLFKRVEGIVKSCLGMVPKPLIAIFTYFYIPKRST
jgi:hypothetical protein